MTWMDRVSFAPEIVDRWLRTKKLHDRLLLWLENESKIKDVLKQYPYDMNLKEELEISEMEVSSAKKELQKLLM